MNYKEYIKTTKEGYRGKERAFRYKNGYTSKLNFKNFKSKIIAARERAIVGSFLKFTLRQDRTIKNILDVPVGTGKMTDILLDFGFEVVSGDISKEMMDFIGSHLKRHPNYIEEKIIDASSLPYKDNYFDLILNIRLMHRVDPLTRIKILKEAHRVTKGYYIVSFGINSLWQNIRIKFKKRDPSPGREFKKKLKREITNIGFNIIEEKKVLPILSNEVIFLLKK